MSAAAEAAAVVDDVWKVSVAARGVVAARGGSKLEFVKI